MTIRLIAKELYALRREVEELEKRLESASSENKDRLEEQLRRVRAERDRMKRLIEGHKDPSPYRKPR
jgi:hypothetical protein